MFESKEARAMKRKTGVIQAAILLAVVVGLAVPGLAAAQGKGGGKDKKPAPQPEGVPLCMSFRNDLEVDRIYSDDPLNPDSSYCDGDDGAVVEFHYSDDFILQLKDTDPPRRIQLDFERPYDGPCPPSQGDDEVFDCDPGLLTGDIRTGFYMTVEQVYNVPITGEGSGCPSDFCNDDNYFVVDGNGDLKWVLRRAAFYPDQPPKKERPRQVQYYLLRFHAPPALEEEVNSPCKTAFVRVMHPAEGIWVLSPETQTIGSNQRVANLASLFVGGKYGTCGQYIMPFEATLTILDPEPEN
jgi:hypothetical protein